MTIVAAANRDERHFDNPNYLILVRENEAILSVAASTTALAQHSPAWRKIFGGYFTAYLIFWLILSQLASEAPSYFVAMRT